MIKNIVVWVITSCSLVLLSDVSISAETNSGIHGLASSTPTDRDSEMAKKDATIKKLEEELKKKSNPNMPREVFLEETSAEDEEEVRKPASKGDDGDDDGRDRKNKKNKSKKKKARPVVDDEDEDAEANDPAGFIKVK